MRIKKILKNNIVYLTYFKWRYVRNRPLPGYPSIEEEINFYSDFINSNSLVFDIGANHGDKTHAYAKLGKNVIALEPDRANNEFLNYRFKLNKRVKIVNKAASSEIGKATFFINNPGSGLNTIDSKRQEKMQFKNSYEVQTITLDTLIHEFGIPDFIKIDVEGHELSVIKGLSKAVKMITFEANLSDAIDNTIECIDLIYSLSSKYSFNYGFDVGIESKDWLSKDAISDIIRNSKLSYMNIYCKK